MQGADQGPGAGRETYGSRDLVQHALREPCEDRDPLAQALGEVELPTHRGLGDGVHLLGTPGMGREELDDLVLDEGRVDVEDDKPAPATSQARGGDGEVHSFLR